MLLLGVACLAWGGWRRRGDAELLRRSADYVGVAPPWRAPKWVWKRAWRLHGALLPALHFFEKETTRESCVNLRVLWLKALDGDAVAYSLLPRWTRLVVSRGVRRLYPRLHHANIAMRSAFLDDAVGAALRDDPSSSSSSSSFAAGSDALVISLGAGFDTRSLRLAPRHGAAVRWAEVDLPAVVAQKDRLLRRLPDATWAARPPPQLIAADLSRDAEVRAALAAAARQGAGGAAPRLVFVLEALLIYLEDDQVRAVLEECARYGTPDRPAALVFADRILRQQRVTQDQVRDALASAGWTSLVSYCEKPGLARHMGLAWTHPPTTGASGSS